MNYPLSVVSSLVAGLLLASCTTSSTVVKETYSGVLPEVRAPKSINYGGESYHVGYSAITTSGVFVEYFRKGQGPKSWTKLISLRTTRPPSTPGNEAGMLLKLAKSTGGSGALLENKNSGEYIADFMLPKSGSLEFNLVRYAPQTGAGGTKSLQYAEMVPHSKCDKKNLLSLRETNLKRIAAIKIPDVGNAN